MSTIIHPDENAFKEDFLELAERALAEIRQKPHPRAMVCGPMTTGGTGNRHYNFEIFEAVVSGLQQQGVHLFNQLPYEDELHRLVHLWEGAGNEGYCELILEGFYATIFESGMINKGIFIPGHASSYGARWERKKLAELGHHIHDFTLAEIRKFLEKVHHPHRVNLLMHFLG